VQQKQTIIAIAADDAVLRSLAFALGVEGFKVKVFAAWRAAQPLIEDAICVIVDVDVCRKDPDARRALADPARRIIVLTDGMPPPDAAHTVRLVAKPLEGTDILAEVNRFRRVRA
jgi:DNA-binding NtrC family response regulator